MTTLISSTRRMDCSAVEQVVLLISLKINTIPCLGYAQIILPQSQSYFYSSIPVDTQIIFQSVFEKQIVCWHFGRRLPLAVLPSWKSASSLSPSLPQQPCRWMTSGHTNPIWSDLRSKSDWPAVWSKSLSHCLRYVDESWVKRRNLQEGRFHKTHQLRGW